VARKAKGDSETADSGDDTPAGRVRAATAGKVPRALCEVSAVDVATLCESIPDDDHTDKTRAYQMGAVNAVKGAKNPGAVKILQEAGILQDVLARAGENGE
jgi:hypothetical protein